MMRILKGIALLTAVLVGVAPGPAAADFATGYAAFQRADHVAAMSELLPLAEAGDARAQFLVGTMLRRGLGTAADPAAAATWFRRATAAAPPDRFALYELGLMTERGEGVERDLAAAAALYQQAAMRGVGSAMLNLGLLVSRGQGVPRDPERALRLFFRALEAGEGGAIPAFDAQARIAGREPPATGRWQAAGYLAPGDDLTVRTAPESVSRILGHRLVMQQGEFAIGRQRCPAPRYLVEPADAAYLSAASAGATAVLPAARAHPSAVATVVCQRQVMATLGILDGDRLLLPALGGNLVFEPIPSPRVAEVQQRLAALGEDPGGADGLLGPRTIAAIRHFQQQAGLAPTGALSPAFMAVLARSHRGPQTSE